MAACSCHDHMTRNALHAHQHSGYVTRTASLCGMNSELDLSTCSTLISCFDDNESLEGWIGCMENGVRSFARSTVSLSIWSPHRRRLRIYS